MKKKWFIVIIGIIMILAILLILPLCKKVQITTSTMLYRNGNSDESQPITISLDGTYKRFLTKQNTFEGSIEITGIEELSYINSEQLSLVFHNNTAVLYFMHYNAEKGDFESQMLGDLIIDDSFDNFMLTVFEPVTAEVSGKTWSITGGLFLTNNAQSRDDAIENAKALCRDNEWFSEIIWK